MELVKGVPITQYCDEKRLPLRQRLELFLPVCQAVQHAHQKGVIHRDIKPTNVLVAEYDNHAVPKVIDFGVAKATAQKLTERTMFTEFGQVVGTFEYMSPEQAKLNQLDIDTRSDIYSLGVLLYELLTGSTPFERKRLNEAAFDEMLRIIREEEPQRPSTRLTTLAQQAASTVSAQRSSAPDRLSMAVRGELDWIVMKCLDKERNRRYESANALAQDIQRYLNDEPVLACPPSVTYRAGKFVRRHKWGIAAAATLIGGLLLAGIGLGFGTVLVWRANLEARRLTYFQQVALAEREWAASNFKRADELLALCPMDLRGWEWNYVKRLRARSRQPLRHENSITDCAVSPDGTQIVSLDQTGQVHFWDAATGRETRPPIRGHAGSEGVIPDVAFRPDRRQFATAGWRDVIIWDARSGAQLHAWNSPAKDAMYDSIYGIAFDAAGRLFACVSMGTDEAKSLSIWDPVTGRRRFDLPHVKPPVLDLAVSPDGRVLALACLDNAVRLVDAKSGIAKRTFQGPGAFWCVSFSPDGSLVAAGTASEGSSDSGAIFVWEVGSGREQATLTGHGALCLVFSPDGERLATGGSDQAVKIWDIASGREILTLRGHADFVQGIGITSDGSRLVSGGDRSLRIWDGSPWNDDGEKFGDEFVTLTGHAESVDVVTFHPRLPELVTASTDGCIKAWDTQSWRESRSTNSHFRILSSLVLSPHGNRMAVVGSQGEDKTPVVILDTDTFSEQMRLGEPSGWQFVAWDASGRRLAIASEERSVTVYDVATGTAEKRFPSPSKFAYGVAFSQDDRLLAACYDDLITVWDTTIGREIDASPLCHRGLIYSMAFSRDSRFLASGGWDRTVRIWDTTTWKPAQVFIDADAAPQAVTFSPDGQFVAWGATDCAVKLWNRNTDELHTFRGHLGNIRSVAFSPDGRWLASGSEDATVKVWMVPDDEDNRTTSTSGTVSE
jgi:WD40 repeat protein